MDSIQTNKENMPSLRGKEEVLGGHASTTPLRTPLQQVNGSRVSNMRKARYSLITPCGTPTMQTPRRPLLDTPRPAKITVAEDKAPEESVGLNALIYKKINEVIAEKETEHAVQLAAKEAVIRDLEAQIVSLKVAPAEDDVSSEDQAVANFVQTVLQGAVDTLVSQAQTSTQDACEESFVVLEDKKVEECHTENTEDASEVLSSSIMVDAKCSPCPTPTILTPNMFQFTLPGNGPCSHCSEICHNSEVKDAETFTLPGIVVTSDVAVQYDVQETFSNSMASLITDTPCRDGSPRQSLLVPVNDQVTMVTPVTQRSCETGITPLMYKDSDTMYTPVKFTTVDTETETMSSSDSGTAMTPIRVVDSAVAMTPIRVVDSAVAMTPIRVVDSAVAMTPIRAVDSAVAMTPVRSHSVETSTDILSCTSMSTMVTPVKMSDGAVAMIPCRQESVETMTDIPSCETGTMVTPIKSTHSETMTTPRRPVKDAAVVTSPFVPALPRPSELEFRSMSTEEFSSYLETATISNTLLRSELESLQHEKESMALVMADMQTEIAGTDTRVRQAKHEAKSAVIQEMNSLEEQQKDSESKIHQMEERLVALTTELAENNARHHAAMATLRQENENLQHDLVRAYRQRKQEVAALETEYRSKDYQPYYEEAQKTIRRLESQLAPYLQLKDTIDESNSLQDQLKKSLDAFSEFLIQQSELFTQQKKEFSQQHSDWERRMADNDQKTLLALVANSETQEKFADLMARVDVAETNLNEEKTQHEVTTKELMSYVELKEELEQKLETLQADLPTLQENLREATEQAAVSQSKELLLVGEMERLQDKLDAAEAELISVGAVADEKTGQLAVAEDKMKELSVKLEFGTAALARCKEERDEAVTGRVYLQDLLKKQQGVLSTLQTAKHAATTEINRLQLYIKNLTQASQETQDFMDEERRLLSEELGEKQQEIQVKSLEISRMSGDLEAQTAAYGALKSEAQQLRDRVNDLEEELDATKTQAHYMLLQQGSEISDSIVATERLRDTLDTLNEQLAAQVGRWAKPEDQIQTVQEDKPEKKSSSHRRSFVTSILDAFEGSSTPPEEQPTNDVPDVGPSSSAFGGYPGSAFKKVRTKSAACSLNFDMSPDHVTALTASHDPGAANDSADGFDDVDAVPVQEATTKRSISEHIGSLSGLMDSIVKNIKHLEKAVSARVTELQEDLFNIHETLEHSKEEQAESLQYAEHRLKESQRSEAHLRGELTTLRERMSCLTNDMMVQSQVAVQEQVDLLTLQQANKKLQKEVERLGHTLEKKDSELRIVNDTLDATLGKLSSKGNASYGEVEAIKENLILKREVKSLQTSKVKLKWEMEDISTAAKRRVIKLEQNWHKAETEVRQLDELVDQARKVLTAHRADVERWPDSKKLYHLGLLENLQGAGLAKDLTTPVKQ